MKHIFIINGKPMTGKTTLGSILINTEVIDDFVVNNKNCKNLVINLLKKHIENYVAIICNCEKADLYLLIEKLKILNVPISICEMEKNN